MTRCTFLKAFGRRKVLDLVFGGAPKLFRAQGLGGGGGGGGLFVKTPRKCNKYVFL